MASVASRNSRQAWLSLVHSASEDEVRGRPIGDWLGRIEADVSALLTGAHAHGLGRIKELAASLAAELRLLALEQCAPDVVVGLGIAVPRLLDHAGGVDRYIAFIGL